MIQPTEPHPLFPTELSIVVPVYRSAPTLRLFTSRLLSVLESITPDFEVVFVDDGSPDDAWQILSQLQAEHPERIVAVQLMRNFGQHNALMCGFRTARGRLVVTMDDDLQNPPEEVPKLVATMLEGNFDLVYGTPQGAKRQAAWRNLGSFVVNAFYRKVFHSSIPISSFRIIRRELLEAIFPYNLNYTFVDGLLAWNTQRIGEVAVEHHPRAVGRSGYSHCPPLDSDAQPVHQLLPASPSGRLRGRVLRCDCRVLDRSSLPLALSALEHRRSRLSPRSSSRSSSWEESS